MISSQFCNSLPEGRVQTCEYILSLVNGYRQYKSTQKESEEMTLTIIPKHVHPREFTSQKWTERSPAWDVNCSPRHWRVVSPNSYHPFSQISKNICPIVHDEPIPKHLPRISSNWHRPCEMGLGTLLSSKNTVLQVTFRVYFSCGWMDGDVISIQEPTVSPHENPKGFCG